MIKYLIGNVTYDIENKHFPAGEVGIGLSSEKPSGWGHPVVTEATVIAYLATNDDIMKLLLTVDALRREYVGIKLKARIPYMPYARQDRVCNRGDAHSAAVMADLINNLGFEEVVVLDPHSDVMSALIKNIVVITQTDVFRRVHNNWSNIYIVAPDAGAYKKSAAFAKAAGAKGVITCNKERDMATGHITSLTMSADVTGLNLFVLDDICDGGRTFIELANLTGQANRVELAVTHGLFTKGIEAVATHFDRLYTTTSFKGVVPTNMPANVVYFPW